MQASLTRALAENMRGFRLPTYEEIPDVGLYLEQVVKYISEALDPLQPGAITASMISNYVKKGLVDNAVRKQYYREQIAHLIFIAVAKISLGMEDIRLLIQLQRRGYDSRVAYEYFRLELENVLMYVFGLKEELGQVGVEHSLEKQLLRNTIIAAAHRVNLEKSFALLRQKEAQPCQNPHAKHSGA